jgi:hypothetical protein
MKLLVDGEGSFTTRGTIKYGHAVPTTFTSKIVDISPPKRRAPPKRG